NIIPSLQAAKILLSHTYIHTSFAYQPYPTRIRIKQLKLLNQFPINPFYPHLTIYLHLHPQIPPQTILKNNTQQNTLHKHYKVFHEKLIQP
ncbi:nucleoside/nucleotide kinase family protein, partial [Staphylococcus epidermidis]